MNVLWRQRGFGAIAAIVVLVILALLAAGIVAMTTSQQMSSTQDLLSARAWQAARAGNEWGLYQALKGGGCPESPGTTTTPDIPVKDFHVTVTCIASPKYDEGGIKLVVYQVTAVACTAAACTAADASVAAAGAGYVERTRVVLATNDH